MNYVDHVESLPPLPAVPAPRIPRRSCEQCTRSRNITMQRLLVPYVWVHRPSRVVRHQTTLALTSTHRPPVYSHRASTFPCQFAPIATHCCSLSPTAAPCRPLSRHARALVREIGGRELPSRHARTIGPRSSSTPRRLSAQAGGSRSVGCVSSVRRCCNRWRPGFNVLTTH